MNLLLDTHALLWFVSGDPRMGCRGREAIEDEDTTSFVSIATWWEIEIKHSIGKLHLEDPFESFMALRAAEGYQVLQVDPPHLIDLNSLPFHHRDPFDRMIISQARRERMPVCTSDPVFDAYDIETVW